MLLICFDGSEDARAAIAHAGTLFPGQSATVLSVWAPFTEVVARSSLGIVPVIDVDIEKIDQASERRAQELAQEGAGLAGEAGLDAQSRAREQETTVAAAILHEARAVDADAVVMGSRGLTGLKSALVGSVSHAVIQHADRTVVVVPSPSVAAERHRRAQELES
ncbi:MAG TPA: universal stress protein [Solirubrobacteraceae bacterium]|nr:universal stress protein [Solirubrobacteraceae bacterium]